MFWHEKQVLRNIIRILKEKLPDRIVSAHAFGSRVRGDHKEWSDFDVLVLVRDKTPKLEAEIISVFVDEELKAGLSFAPVIKDIQAFNEEKALKTPFYENVVREGVLL